MDAPSQIRLFPIRGCIMLPGEALPLNVFEPRYLNMVDDAMAADRFIGIIQPAGGSPQRPGLQPVGTAGRIVSHRETEDGRYLVVLQGVARFRVADELDTRTPYRVARADYAGFEADLGPAVQPSASERQRFMALLRRFFEQTGIEADWPSIEKAPVGAITDRVAMAAPFEPPAKQALLEAPDTLARSRMLAGMMAALVEGAGPGAPH
jgi:Lon protease-like protein